MDSLGRFNAEAYEQFLRNPGPENEEALVSIENQLKSDLLRSKLTNILTSSVIVSEETIRSNFVENNVDFTVSYVFFDPRVLAAGDTAAPKQQEFDAYYTKNKERFKVEDMRKIKYIIFPDLPSKSDTNAIANELNSIRELSSTGTDFLELVSLNSEQPYDSTQWFTRDQVSEVVADSVFSHAVGDIVGPLPSEIGLSLFKVMNSRQSANTLYHAAHILLRTDGGQDDATQKAKAQEVFAKAKSGQNFTQLAAQFSEEPGAAERGGILPWFGKGRMVEEFQDAVMKARPGEIVGPVKTQFGYHVIKVMGTSNREVQLAEVRMSIRAGSRTRDELFERARNFAYFASENGFEKEALDNELEILETPEFAKQTGSYIPGIGTNPALIKFAFEYGVGEISEVYRSASGYVVCMVSEERDAGYRALDELKEQIAAQVVYERQVNTTMESARKIAGKGKTLQQIVEGNSNLSVATTPPFKLSSGVPNIGPDQAFIGRILGTEVGKRTVPFRGLRGVFVARVDAKSKFDETAYKVKKDEIRQEKLSTLQNEFIQSWIEQKRGEIEIVDNRDRFFR
jgi:parvulin-like peptidyl-prolyl isomerase